MHVAHAVAADEVDVDVEDVRALALLLARERDEAVPVLRVQQVAHLLRARGVDALADDEERSVLHVRLLDVDRGGGRDEPRLALLRRETAHALDEQLQMLGRRPAAAADDVDSRSRCAKCSTCAAKVSGVSS